MEEHPQGNATSPKGLALDVKQFPVNARYAALAVFLGLLAVFAGAFFFAAQ